MYLEGNVGGMLSLLEVAIYLCSIPLCPCLVPLQ